MNTRSDTLHHRAQQLIPGGVNSPVRAFKSVGGNPVYMHHATGPYLFDEDAHRYIDFICSWGAVLLGHNHPLITQAVIDQMACGLGFGTATALECELAEKLICCVPSMDMVRLVNSGTEATMSAIRLARGFTGRQKIIKFDGCYHGHSDSLLVNAGSGALTLGQPSSAGVPQDFVKHTLCATYNCLDEVTALFEQYGPDIAAVIVEPIAGNMNMVCPDASFLQGLRALCDDSQSVLIFDEVMTGFRVALGGAQAHYNVKPDLTTLGKVIGAGLPVGAFGGRKAIMEALAPVGDVYQAGTLSGNPIAVRAGLTQIEMLMQPGFFSRLSQRAARLVHGIQTITEAAGVACHAQQVGGMFGYYFTEQWPIKSLAAVKQSNLAFFKRFYHAALQVGLYFAPSLYEAGFISDAHDEAVIDDALTRFSRAIDNAMDT